MRFALHFPRLVLSAPVGLGALSLAACSAAPMVGPGDDGTWEAPVALTPGEGSEQNPCLSPDGLGLVFTRFEAGYNEGPSEILRLDLTSGQEEVLVAAGESDHVNLPGRCLSSDGAVLAFSSDEEERDEIWTLDLGSRATRRLTDHPGQVSYEPAFTWDDAWIVYESGPEDGAADLWRVRPDGSGDHEVLSEAADDRQPNPSPVEGVVLFQSDRGGTWGLWTVPVTGGAAQALRDTPAEETDASYQACPAEGGCEPAVIFATDESTGLSSLGVLQDGEDLQLLPAGEGWYFGAPAMAADGAVFFEASEGEPEGGDGTRIYRRARAGK